MSAAATAEPMLQTELWISFVSLLRSYAAAASLHAGEVRVHSNPETVTISAGAGELEMQFDSELGRVAWTRRAAGQAPITGTLTLEPEGTVSNGGVVRDLDHAAIDFIASITGSAGGGA